ncbi:hypothetical protein ACPA9J_08390 [Pseudomonas aeruginosa]
MKKPDLAGLAAFVAIARETQFPPRRRHPRRNPADAQPHCANWKPSSASACSTAPLATSRRPRPASTCPAHLDPAFEDIAAALDSLNRFRETPHGLVRINAPRNAIGLVLAPRFGELARDHPGITLEVVADGDFRQYRRSRFRRRHPPRRRPPARHARRAGRPDLRLAIVATPAYFRRQGRPG